VAKLGLRLAPKVLDSLAAGIPVIALESALITHGLPYPENILIARKMEQMARVCKVVAATIAIIEGVIHVGLNESEYARLSELSKKVTEKPLLKKIQLRDIPLAVAERWTGGTTVSATLYLAHMAGLSIFVTGGIGGVHRGWTDSMDISSDLTALSRYPMIVVSSGCKAILDIPATLEQLESLAIPVYGWKTDFCPAFYSHASDFPIQRIKSVKDISTVYHEILNFWGTEHSPSLVVMNPIPSEHSIPMDVIQPAIDEAVGEAANYGIKGKNLTPWLLKRLSQITQGKSLNANKELLLNNVRLGCEIAKTMS
jgi:pseudouridine-5'-phosphate glycosidase